MKEQGVVISTNEKYATIRIGRNSACASCGKCGMTENQKHVDFFAPNEIGAQKDDVVEVDIPEQNTVGMALVGYALPLVPALIALFVGLKFDLGDFWSILLFFGGYFVGMGVVALFDVLKKHKWGKQPTITKIVKKAGKTDEQSNAN